MPEKKAVQATYGTAQGYSDDGDLTGIEGWEAVGQTRHQQASPTPHNGSPLYSLPKWFVPRSGFGALRATLRAAGAAGQE